MLKWLISCVFPGEDDVLASFLRLQSMLIKLLLPTLDLPIKANSGRSVLGHSCKLGELFRNVASLMSKILIDFNLLLYRAKVKVNC